MAAMSRKGVKVLAMVMIAAAALAVAGAYFLMYGGAGDFAMRAYGPAITYDAGSRAAFYACDGKGFFFASKDGIQYYQADGALKMDGLYSMTAPALTGAGGFAAVYEPMGKEARVYSETGLCCSLDLPGPALSMSVSAAGRSCVIVQMGGGYEVYVYDERGSVLKKGSFSDPGVIPVSAALSQDGRILALCFIDYNGAAINSLLQFVYTGQNEAMNHVDGIFASLKLEGECAGITRFMDNNRLLAVSDKKLSLIDPERNCARQVLEFDNRLDGIAFFGGSGFALSLGDGMVNRGARPKGLCEFYNLELRLTGSYQASGPADLISAGYDTALICVNGSVTAVSRDGREQWTLAADSALISAMFVDNGNTALLAGNSGARLYRLTRIKEDNP